MASDSVSYTDTNTMTSAASRLPDELVGEILSPILTIREEEFSKAGSTAPSGRRSASTLSVLLVSKQFLRVGTQLLYECIVLRNKFQAASLYHVLRGGNGPHVGRFVRRMRLEGPAGDVVGKIFGRLPRIRELYLRIPTASTEKVIGLVKGLPKLNPSRLIFEFALKSPWKNTFVTVGALCNALRTWTGLVRYVPFDLVFRHY